MITIQDIAADLGLSAMTVSRALNDHPDVADETRVKVQERARELNYRPNRWARSLVTQESKIIGVVAPDIGNYFFSEIIGGVQDIIEERGYTLLVCAHGHSVDRERREVDMLVGSRADGLVIASSHAENEPEEYQELLDETVPFVLIDRYFSGFDCPRVRADDRRSGRLAARHLYDLGHRRIAHITGPNVSTAQERREGFLEELARLEVSVPEEYVAASDFSFGGGYLAMKRLLALPKPPTAVFCANDPNAMGAVRAARDQGLVVPLHVSVMGAGRFEGDQLPAPFLTSTDWSRREMGEHAGRMLLELIAQGAVSGPLERVMEPRLIIRQSTGPPPG